jgi:hypothetical protein
VPHTFALSVWCVLYACVVIGVLFFFVSGFGFAAGIYLHDLLLFFAIVVVIVLVVVGT